jgi:hypothetical protein
VDPQFLEQRPDPTIASQLDIVVEQLAGGSFPAVKEETPATTAVKAGFGTCSRLRIRVSSRSAAFSEDRKTPKIMRKLQLGLGAQRHDRSHAVPRHKDDATGAAAVKPGDFQRDRLARQRIPKPLLASR